MKYVVTVVFILVIGAGSVGVTGAVLNYLRDYGAPEATPTQGIANTPYGPMKRVSLSLDTFPMSPDQAPGWEAEHGYKWLRDQNVPATDKHEDWVTYGPTTTLVVPNHSVVTITIHQYDSGLSLLNDFYSQVRGTIGGTMTVDGKTMSSIPDTDVAHTFTIHGYPSAGQPWLFVSVPLMKLPDDVVSAGKDNKLPPNPHVITFSFYVFGKGHYVWQCEYPCGNYYNGFGGAMSTEGFMNGSFDVV